MNYRMKIDKVHLHKYFSIKDELKVKKLTLKLNEIVKFCNIFCMAVGIALEVYPEERLQATANELLLLDVG